MGSSSATGHTDESYMRECFALAQQAAGHTAPNPMVGAVLVHQSRIIGSGYHHFYGADHAEVNCLANVAAADRQYIPDSTMYVNLEPCAHYGLTPPCAVRLVAERVKEVVLSNTDPFEKVSGKGIGILRSGGIRVRTGILENEGRWLNRRFFCFNTRQRPYIILKWAQSADGNIAPADRARFAITGSEVQALVHKWRTEEGAILVGTTTALTDNPRLTARLYKGKQPLRLVIDRRLAIPHTHHLFDNEAATWIFNESREELLGNVQLVNIDFRVNILPVILQKLYAARILSLIVEGGAYLLRSFIDAGLWDEARVLTGPGTLAGGIGAPSLPVSAADIDETIGQDHLQVFINPNSHYPYCRGMEL